MNATGDRPELAAVLDRLVPAEESVPRDWDDVVARANRTARRRTSPRRARPLRLALVLIAIFLVLAGVATATYLATRLQPPPAVTALDRDGRLRTLWSCPSAAGCGAFVTAAAVSRDGRRLAFVTDSVNDLSLYQGGLHLVDLETGADRHVPATPASGANTAAWRRQQQAAAKLLGCAVPQELAWSPDGSLLAYVCTVVRRGVTIGSIHTIRADGSQHRVVPTVVSAYWPTWSPDGNRLAFSTQPIPIVHTSRADDAPRRWITSSIFVVDRDGSHRRLVTGAGAAPDWSPDGTTIAYGAVGCAGRLNETGRTRLVTPDGRDVTPGAHRRCGGIGPASHAIPAWSPDGRRLAIRTWNGLFVTNEDGSHAMAVPGTDGFGSSRPLWQVGAGTDTR